MHAAEAKSEAVSKAEPVRHAPAIRVKLGLAPDIEEFCAENEIEIPSFIVRGQRRDFVTIIE
jgi:hypothetical protein